MKFTNTIIAQNTGNSGAWVYNSLYGKLSEITMKTGELLIAGMEVGKADRSKNLNVPALYFEIRYKGKPVNPLPWLK
jgi:septal ring factor EnvC (AmiA/AmiB activator)